MIHIIDIGDHPVDPPGYQVNSQCHITGFDAQAGSAIGDGEAHTLYVCRAPGLTSLLRPDNVAMASFGFAAHSEILATPTVPTRRLDDVCQGWYVDLLKLDIQGGELMALEHGEAVLDRAAAVHIELSYTPLYHNQPPYYILDKLLREHGFRPHLLLVYKQFGPCLLEIDWLYVKRDDPRIEEIVRTCYKMESA